MSAWGKKRLHKHLLIFLSAAFDASVGPVTHKDMRAVRKKTQLTGLGLQAPIRSCKPAADVWIPGYLTVGFVLCCINTPFLEF